jgi:16S rRNA (uracil1498-N3)-methyltransferase
MSAIPRLYLDQPFAPGQTLPLSDAQANYLFAVLRLTQGAEVDVFNGRDGEWRATVAQAAKRAGVLRLEAPQAPQVAPPDLWLVFAPLKKARTDMVVEKAVELGAARLCPVLTDYTQGERIRPDKMAAHVIEAAEQCGATHVPGVDAPVKLAALLAGWDPARALVWCDEGLARLSALPGGRAFPAAPAAILIGPEGGFSPAERARLAALPFAHPIRLGPRILRAETAALAALALWQQAQGDWL